jgi:hypothetical protein
MSFDPNLFVAKCHCGLVGPEDMPGFAADALEAGFDGPALRRLAGLVKPSSSDVGGLFDRAIDEIGTVEIRSKEQAIFKLARILAKTIVDGQVDPILGARGLASYALQAGYPDGLAQFDQLADEPLWGDYARRRDLLCADIIAEAKKLIASTPA